MKKLRALFVALCLILTLTFATVPTVVANDDGHQGTTKDKDAAPPQPPPPPSPLDPIIVVILIFL